MVKLLGMLGIYFAALALVLMINSENVAAEDPDQQVIRDLCQRAESPDFCFSTLSADSRSRGKNFGQLIYLSIVLSNEKGKEDMAYISELQKKTTDPLVKETLTYCGDRYKLGPVTATNTALVRFNDADYQGASISLSSCITSVEECVRAFKSPPYPTYVTAETDVLMEKHCFLALDLVNSLGN